MNLEKQNIYLIGIGGIGMSALARYFNQIGKNVTGYDRSTTELTRRLQTEGISVSDFSEADTIPDSFRNKEDTLVIYTPAVSKTNPILVYFKEEGFECLKRAEVLGQLSKSHKTIAVAGTHGKTTVSSMIAFLLHKAGIKINALLGGISRDFGTNIVLDAEAKIMVTEADEYDRSFLQLHPNYLVVTSMDLDHLDIYEDAADLKATYQKLVDQVERKGVFITKPKLINELKFEHKKYSYHLIDQADIKAENIHVENGNFVFDYHSKKVSIEKVKCGLPGMHNVENALAAITIALEFGVESKKVKQFIGEFRGVKRRFDVHLKTNNFVYIDDYAHHPEEIKMLLTSVREMYPDKKITTVFQPHLFSRTQDFADDFAIELGKSDDLVLLEIYPAREEPIEGVNSLWLSKKIGKKGVNVCEKHHLMNVLKSKEIEVLLTVGAGDIDTMIEPIVNYYSEPS